MSLICVVCVYLMYIRDYMFLCYYNSSKFRCYNILICNICLVCWSFYLDGPKRMLMVIRMKRRDFINKKVSRIL